MKLFSPEFETGGFMPKVFTQQGENVSPPLVIEDVPQLAKTLALVCLDPDAPDPEHPLRTFTHWIAYNLPTNLKELPKAVKISSLSPISLEGYNDRNEIGYVGPRPPIGTHRYFFKLYALDTTLKFNEPPKVKEFLEAIDGHVIESAGTMGLYKLQ